MPFQLDPTIGEALGALATRLPAPSTADEPWRAIRESVAATYPVLTAQLPTHEVNTTVYTARTEDGGSIALHWFEPTTAPTTGRPAVVHAHGGGMVAGEVALFAPFIREYVALSGVPFLSVDYRLAPERSGDGPARDVLAGVAWLHEHASDLDVDPARIAVMGESAGAGLAAGAAILAGERGLHVAKQMLIYPMLDDRTVADPHLEGVATWTGRDNEVGWRALLRSSYRTDQVPVGAAPGRLTSGAGLPPAYLEVGDVDIFRDETVRFASLLWGAGIDAELHVLPGLVHGWDHYAPATAIRRAVLAQRIAALTTF